MAVNPRIEIFEAKRATKNSSTNVVPDDQGESLVFSIKTSFGDASRYLDFGLYITVYESDKWKGYTRVGSKDILPGNSILTSLKEGVTDSFIIGDIPSNVGQSSALVFSQSKSYRIDADLTNGSEHSRFSVSVPFAFVNMHLSASSSGGIAFGKYLENAGYFECKYPTRIYNSLRVDGNNSIYGSMYVKNSNTGSRVAVFEGNGISVTNIGSSYTTLVTPGAVSTSSLVVSNTMSAQNGRVSTSVPLSVNGDATVSGNLTANNFASGIVSAINQSTHNSTLGAGEAYSFNVGFGKTFPKVPGVAANLIGANGDNCNKCQLWVIAVYDSSFSVTVKNNDSVTHFLGITWVAFSN